MNVATFALLFASLTILPVSAHSQTRSREETAAARAEIHAAREASNQALQHRDIQAFAASLDSDFVMIRGNGVLVPTRQAYIDTFSKDFADPESVSYRRVPVSVVISNAAPVAAEKGDWYGRRPDGKLAYEGTYMAMWHKTASGWKLRSELFVVLGCADEAACAAYRKP